MYRHGLPIKKEFRGARTVEAFINFIKDQLINPLKIAKSYSDYSVALMEVKFKNSQLKNYTMVLDNNFQLKKRTIIGHFFDEKSERFKVFSKLSSILRDSCNFVAGIK